MNNTNSRVLPPNKIAEKEDRKPLSHQKVLIYADGSCLRNGTEFAQAGAGVVVVSDDFKIKLKACYLGALTNQKAEILACAIGLESLEKGCQIDVFSGSQYVVETMLGKNRMKTNRHYWNRLIQACLTHKIEWHWIRGHSGDLFQETSDRLSRAAAIARENLGKKTLEQLARMLLEKPDAATISMIHDGIKTLAAACDGAKRADKRGFDKFDSEIGKQIANKSALTISEALEARTLLTKYRGQIARFDRELALLL